VADPTTGMVTDRASVIDLLAIAAGGTWEWIPAD